MMFAIEHGFRTALLNQRDGSVRMFVVGFGMVDSYRSMAAGRAFEFAPENAR